METLSETVAADGVTREKESCPPATSLSLPSYNDYPAHSPFINALMPHTPQTHTPPSYRTSSPSKAFPETKSAAILSALRNLQGNIRKMELEKREAELSLCSLGRETSHSVLQSEQVTQTGFNNQTAAEREKTGKADCNQVLITHLAAAESRCLKLERQLDHMKRMLHSARTERTSLLKQQMFMEKEKSAYRQSNTTSERAQIEKLERLEQEYQRLTHTQTNAEMKISELEVKVQEEEHQRKLMQAKAKQLQTGVESNRILLQLVSSQLSIRQNTETKSTSKKASPGQLSCTQPHYRLSLRDVPFVTGTSVGCSHSVRSNVQSVLSLLKQHQPHLCNSHVLSRRAARSEMNSYGHSESSSFPSSSCEEDLLELLQALQEELRVMSLEHDELLRKVEISMSTQERTDLQREQEKLLLKMEMKGEQISKLYKHKAQMKKLRKEADSRFGKVKEVRGIGASAATRGHSARAVKVRPGERSRGNLKLLRDMRALQTSLQT